MADKDLEKKLLELERQLLWLSPAVWNYPVVSPDPSKNMLFLPLEDVLYITTASDDPRYDVMFVSAGGARHFSAKPLSQIAKDIAAGNPRFLQTAKAYIVNLTKVSAFAFSSARDLWFEGQEEPVANAVTDHYLDAFVQALPH